MLHIISTDLRAMTMRTRIPFRYGITTLTACPHVFVTVTLDVDGRRATGHAADHLAPKWFTKNPDTPIHDDIRDMVAVIRSAADYAVLSAPAPDLYSLISRIHFQQSLYYESKKFPPLLYNFGVSLIERAIIDAFCRATNTTFSHAIRHNLFNIRFTAFPDEHMMLEYPELIGASLADLLPSQPLQKVIARHTVGMLDYLTDAQIPPAQRVDDGLPQSLEAAIAYYGLTHFKIKVPGDLHAATDRLQRLFDTLSRAAHPDWRFTFDFNENFNQIAPFRDFWKRLTADGLIRPHLPRLDFVEQPLHRHEALSDKVKLELATWPGRPPIIIDESDGYPGAARRALECGYAGTSHKNCKGILKGLANVALINLKRRKHPIHNFILSGEDLCNVGPIALNQDLAFDAAVGIANIERNGHHFMGGLTAFPPELQQDVLDAHPDLYRQHENGFVTLNLHQGQLDVSSLTTSPFGLGFDFDPSPYTPLHQWTWSG